MAEVWSVESSGRFLVVFDSNLVTDDKKTFLPLIYIIKEFYNVINYFQRSFQR
jgi:hypothetical protein